MNKTKKTDKYMRAYLKHKKRFSLAMLATAAVPIMIGSLLILFQAIYEIINCTLQDNSTGNCFSKGLDYLPWILTFWGLLLFFVLIYLPLYFLSTHIAQKKQPALNILRKQPHLIIDCKASPDTFPLILGAGRGLSIILRPLEKLTRKIIGQELYMLSLKVLVDNHKTKNINIQLLKEDALGIVKEFHGWTWIPS